MKGIAPIIALLLIGTLMVGAAVGYNQYKESKIERISINMLTPMSEIGSDVSILPYEEAPPTPPSDTGEFIITCDKDTYTGLINQYYNCHITNTLPSIQDVSVKVLLDDRSSARFSELSYKDTCSRTECKWVDIGEIVNTYDSQSKINGTEFVSNWVCNEIQVNYLCWKQVNIGTATFDEYGKNYDSGTIKLNPGETKDIRLKIETPIGSNGKFNIVATSLDGIGVLDPWYSGGWTNRVTITLNHTGYDDALFNFPVLVHINSTRVDMDDVQDDGDDIRFTNYDNTTELSFEIEQANSTDVWAWVKVPYISTTTATTIYMYYNNPTASNGENIADVWTNNYSAVYHMSNTTGATVWRDSAHYGTKNNAIETNIFDFNNGTIANATGYLSASTSHLDVADDATIQNIRSIELIARPATVFNGGNKPFLNKGGGANWYVENVAGGLRLAGNAAGSLVDTSFQYFDNQPWYFAWTINGSLAVVYINGTQDNSAALTLGTLPTGAGSGLEIGKEGGNYLDGMLDEVRLSSTQRNNTWVKATYLTINENPLFITYGSTSSLWLIYGNETYSSPVYETLNASHYVDISSTYDATITGKLNWNDTEYSVTALNATPKNWNFTRDIIPPLVTSSGQDIDFFWNFTVDYMNGTILYNQTTNERIQTVNYGYYLNTPSVNSSTPTSGEGVRISSTLVDVGSATVYNISGIFDGDYYTTSGAYYFDISVPMVATATLYDYGYGMTVAYGSNTLYRETGTGTLTVAAISIETGALTDGLPCLDYQYFKEESPYEAMNATHNLAITVWKSDPTVNATFNFSLSSGTNHTLFLNPSYADVYAFSVEEYWNNLDIDNVTYPTRNYYLNGLHISNVSQNVSLYLLNSSYADVVGFSVLDIYAEGISNVIIDAQRYYPGENLFRTVARGYTDSRGDATIRLFKCTDEDSVYHKFFLYQDFELIETYEQMCLIDDVYTFPIEEESPVSWWNMYGDVGGACNFYNTTQLLVCEFASSDGNTFNAELYVQEIKYSGATEICNTTMSATSGSLTCDLSGMTSEEYHYIFGVYDSDYEWFTIASSSIKNVGFGNYGTMGIFLALTLIITLAFVGYQSPFMMMILSMVGILSGWLLQMYEVSWAGMIGLLLAGAIIMYGVRER